MEWTRRLGLLLALGTGICVSVAARPAAAASLSCDGGIDYVDYTQVSSSNTLLQIGCISGTTVHHFYAYTSQGSCTGENRTLDTVKGWKSMAEAALLGGRSVILYYNTCGSPVKNYISTFSLRRQ